MACAAKLPSLGSALLREVSRVRSLLYQTPRRHKHAIALDSVTPIGDRGAVGRLPLLPDPVTMSAGPVEHVRAHALA